MIDNQNTQALSGLQLGKTTIYKSEYDASLLQTVPRSLNRKELGLNNNALPFYGEDVWYGYEVSWLNNKGKPIVAIAEFKFPCTSLCIIESKSFKLYLNSFNQSSFTSKQAVQQILINDLSNLLQTKITVNLYDVDNCLELMPKASDARCIDDLDVEINDYHVNASILATDTESSALPVTEKLVSHLLKSNCLITNQPDWASVFITYTGKRICPKSLLKYIISYRQHNEFHEQCVERMFCDILEHCQVTELTVFARYTRRGGLDINPYRSTKQSISPTIRTLRQ